MKRLWLLGILCPLLFGQSVEEIIQTALKKSPDLKSIQKVLAQKDIEAKRATLWNNPTLQIGANDIQFQNPFKRDIEPMQTNFVALSQKIPTFGKKEFDKKIVLQMKKVILQEYRLAKNELVKSIYIAAIDYFEAKSKIAIVQNYIDTIQQSIDLYNKLLSTKSQYHLALMQSKLFLSNLKVALEQLQFQQKKSLQKLSFLAATPVMKVENLPKIRLQKGIFPQINKLDQTITYQNLRSKRALLDEKSDIALRVGYYQRDGFNDYVSVSVAIALPIYGKERLKSQEERIKALSYSQKKANIKLYIKSQINTLQENLKKLQRDIKILKHRSIADVDHSLDLMKSRISSGDMLYKYFDLLKSKYKIELDLVMYEFELLRTKVLLNYYNGVYQ